MGILGMKYKAHRFVNILFYGLVFFVGFILGRTTDNLNFSQVFSKFLAIDNVYAVTWSTIASEQQQADISYLPSVPNSTTFHSESYIKNLFSSLMSHTDLNYKLTEYPYVIVYRYFNSSVSDIQRYRFYFSEVPFTGTISNPYAVNGKTIEIVWEVPPFVNYTNFTAKITSSGYNNNYKLYDNSGSGYTYGSNFFTTGTYFLNFFLSFNPEYLEDNSNWTKYCMDSQSSFFTIYPLSPITSNDTQYTYMLNTGQFNHFQYSSLNLNDSDFGLTSHFSSEYYFLNSDTAMSNFSTTSDIQTFNSSYPGLYSNLYGWSIQPFTYSYQSTLGNNIFSGNIVQGGYSQTGIDSQSNRVSTTPLTSVTPGLTYNLSFVTNNSIDSWAFVCYSDSSYSNVTTTGWISNHDFTVPSNCNYLGISFRRSDNASISTSSVTNVTVKPYITSVTLPAIRFSDTYRINVGCVTGSIGGVSQCLAPDNVNNWTDSNIDSTGSLCFYVPSTFGIKEWTTNGFGDIENDNFTIGGVTYSIDTDQFEQHWLNDVNGNSYSGYTGYFSTLIKRLATPLTFITQNISYLFNSLPEPIKYFIISFLVMGLLVGLIKMLTGGK